VLHHRAYPTTEARYIDMGSFPPHFGPHNRMIRESSTGCSHSCLGDLPCTVLNMWARNSKSNSTGSGEVLYWTIQNPTCSLNATGFYAQSHPLPTDFMNTESITVGINSWVLLTYQEMLTANSPCLYTYFYPAVNTRAGSTASGVQCTKYTNARRCTMANFSKLFTSTTAYCLEVSGTSQYSY